MADVTFKHPDYEEHIDEWHLVDDVCAGECQVKKARTKYLPKPNPHDKSKENSERYESYSSRAVFYPATGRTLKGLLGAAFRKVPTLEISGALEYVKDDIDGAGISIYQQSQIAVRQVLKKARHGLLVDYPKTQGDTSAEQVKNGVRARVLSIDAKNITNWRYEDRQGKYALTLLVIKESAVEYNDFGFEEIEQYRVLRLTDIYNIELWRHNDQDDTWFLYDSHAPIDGRGLPWREIPFAFIGADNNDHTIDYSPLADLARLNIAHYRNSADYEDSAFFVGQAQPVITGLTEEWAERLEKSGVYVGSRSPIPLPKESDFKIVQAQPNTLVKEAMDQKERQMIALGARLIEKGSAAKTATQEDNENAEEHSILSLVVQNVAEAYTKALSFVSRFMNVESESFYDISTEFSEHKLDPQMLMALIQAVQSGKYPDSDFWTVLRRTGFLDAEKTDEDIKDELESSSAGLNLDGSELSAI